MRLQCPNCEHQINTEDSSVEVMPPDDAKNNMHAYRCPGCNTKVDFLDWRAITSHTGHGSGRSRTGTVQR